MPYKVKAAPAFSDPDMAALAQYVEDELESVASSQVDNIDALELLVRRTVPVRPRSGMLAYADGALWNPNKGEGLYNFGLDNAWHKLMRSDDFPFILAWEHGVIDDGTDKTAAFQTLVNSLPHGAFIFFRGRILFTTLDLSSKSNLTFIGIDAGTIAGTGFFNRATLESTAGAIGLGNAAINCFQSQNITFDNLFLRNRNPAFDGTLLFWGAALAVGGQDTVSPKVKNCAFNTSTAGSVCMELHGSENGTFSDLIFLSPGIHILGQHNNFALVGFVNSHLFMNILFQPTGTLYPVQGTFVGCTFINCCVEPGSDGNIRFIDTGSIRAFEGLTLIGTTLFDSTGAGLEAMVFPWGQGLTIVGGFGSSPAGYVFALGGGGIIHGDPEERGLTGVSIQGFKAIGTLAMMDFYGTIANKTNVRGLKVFGNSIVLGTVVGAGAAQCENADIGPNNVYGNINAPGAARMLIGWPTFANAAAAGGAGLIAGQEFIATGAARALTIL